MVSFDQVYFSKNNAASQAVIEGLHVGQGVPVRECDGVEVAVVATGAPGAVLLGHQVQGVCPGRVGAANNTSFLQCEELLLSDTQPRLGKKESWATCVDAMYNAVESPFE
jgi:hypothetical protein